MDGYQAMERALVWNEAQLVEMCRSDLRLCRAQFFKVHLDAKQHFLNAATAIREVVCVCCAWHEALIAICEHIGDMVIHLVVLEKARDVDVLTFNAYERMRRQYQTLLNDLDVVETDVFDHSVCGWHKRLFIFAGRCTSAKMKGVSYSCVGNHAE